MKLKCVLSFAALVFFYPYYSFSQSINDSINKERIEKIITYLASDKMGGRVNYTKEQLEAAEFISKEFAADGLEPFPGFNSYYQPFRNTFGNGSDDKALMWNNRKLNDSSFLYFSHSLYSGKKDLNDFKILKADLPVADSILFYNWQDSTNNILVWVNLPTGVNFSETIKKIVIPAGIPASDVLIVGTADEPGALKFSGNAKLLTNTLYNVIGMLPGRSKANEAIIFSAHYDHVDHGEPQFLNGQMHEATGLYNGANDDASGTTAVISLARYFAMRNDNERTLIFCLFAGEELGLLGSNAFVNFIKPESVKAVINIEMIGMTNATGKNAFMVTGSSYTNLVTILKKNLKGQKVKVMEQNYDPKLLFQRSDNYPFASEGIPAHSIMCSDDNEPCYHEPCDDVKRINMDNMTTIIQAIARGCSSLISGLDTPSRIK